MKKAVLIPDSFKGTMSSTEICNVMKERIDQHFPACEVVTIPVADGGEGSVDAFLTALGGEKVWLEVKNPYFEPMQSFYGLIDNGKTAVVEMASCAGLPLVEGGPEVQFVRVSVLERLQGGIAQRDQLGLFLCPDTGDVS